MTCHSFQVKATKVAALSAITAPFRAAKKTIALKVGAVKAVKALKVAKIAKAADILKNLQKSPILVPVQVAVPIKGSAHPIKQFPAIPNFLNIPPPSLSDSLAPIQGIISGAQNAIKSAGKWRAIAYLMALNRISLNRFVFAGIPLLTTFGGKFNKAAAPTQAPVYRFVPEVGLGNYNKVALPAPARIEVDIPANPAAIYGPPPTPADTYGVPH